MDNQRIGLSRRELLQAASGLGLSGAALNAVQKAQAEERREKPRTAQQKEETARARKPFVLGYYPEWKPLDPTQIDFALFTHVCHAFSRIDKEGSLHFPPEAQTKALIEAAHAKKARVLLSVGGANSGASLREQPAEVFADTLVQHVRDAQYDGIDLDWEFPENDDEAAKLSALIPALRKRLGKSLLTMAVPAGNWYGKWFKTEALLPAVDWLNIMTYDFCGPWCDKALHNAPMPEVAASVDYWKGRGWPMQKLLLGIPGYGRRMRASKFGDPAPAGTYVNGEITFNDVAKYVQAGWKAMQDAEAQVPYLVKPEGGELISYEDEASAQRKGQLARKRGLRGVFFWEMTHDFDGKTHLLARAARQGWDASAP